MTGSDTDVGKTHVACALASLAVARGRRVRVYKPVESGCDPEPADAAALARASGDDRPLSAICPVALRAPISPHAAARLEGRVIDVDALVRATARDGDLLLVEGAGGILTPITDDLLVADLAALLGLPLVLVVEDSLGAINRALLTVEVARHRGLPIAGVVLNRTTAADPGPAAATHVEAIARLGGVRVFGPVFFGAVADPSLSPLVP